MTAPAPAPAPASADGTTDGTTGTAGNVESLDDARQSSSIDPSSHPPPPSQHDEPNKHHRHRRRRHRHGALKDTILMYIPLTGVTADLGVALKRTRAKRTRKIRNAFPMLFRRDEGVDDEGGCGDNKDDGQKKKKDATIDASQAVEAEADAEGDDDDDNDEEETMDVDIDAKSKGESSGVSEKGEKKTGESSNKKVVADGEDYGMAHGVPRREQYGSVLDYLEAKYVRGVMIADDLDEKDRKKKKQKKQKQTKAPSGEGDVADDEEEDESDDDDDDGAGSCYSDASGNFLDDSLLRAEVAEQVVAGSTKFGGTTRIEEEARKAKREEQKKRREEGGGGGDGRSASAEEEEDSMDEYDDDDGFFVNVGDLEMADGQEGVGELDYDELAKTPVSSSRKKDKKKSGAKRKRSSKGSAGSGESAKKKAKGTDKKASSSDKKKKKKKKKSPEKTTKASSSPKKKKTKKDAAKKKKKKSDGASSVVTGKTKSSKAGSGDEDGSEEAEEEVSAASSSSSDEESTTTSSVELTEQAKALKDKADALRKIVKEKYKASVDAIKDMGEENLPRKPSKKKKTIKVNVNVPPGKKKGDEITFVNPAVPGQKLKVKIPAKAVSKGRFAVSVPAPAAKENPDKENKFTPQAKRALADYSQAYDDWCEAEGVYREQVPKKKGKFKPTTQRLKKFDDMVDEFPRNLAIPVDVIFLRLVVRRERQNAKKRKDRHKSANPVAESQPSSKGNVEDGDDADDAPPHTIELHVPGKGTSFPTISFNSDDFHCKH